MCVFFLTFSVSRVCLFQSSNVGLRQIQSTEKNNVFLSNDSDSNAKEAWSDMVVRVDNHMLVADNRKILVRCETNIFNLYRGAAEAELKVNEDLIWTHDGKVSPTTDQRSSSSTSSKHGDPDNSALQAGAVRLFGYRLNTFYFLLQVVFLLLITSTLS